MTSEFSLPTDLANFGRVGVDSQKKDDPLCLVSPGIMLADCIISLAVPIVNVEASVGDKGGDTRLSQCSVCVLAVLATLQQILRVPASSAELIVWPVLTTVALLSRFLSFLLKLLVQ